MINFFQHLTTKKKKATGQSWMYMNLDRDPVPENGLYAPANCWDNGHHYVVFHKYHTDTENNAGIVDYHNGTATLRWMPESSSSHNYHDLPTVITNGAGKIYLIHERHESNPDVWTNATPYDISSWSKISNTPTLDYPKTWHKSGNDFVMLGRFYDNSEYTLWMCTFDGATFTPTVKMTETIKTEGVYESRNYPKYVSTFSDDIWTYFLFSERYNMQTDPQNDIIYKYFYAVKFKLDNPFVWYNLDESYHKDIDANGYLTETELNDNFKYDENSEIDVFAFMGANGFHAGKLYDIHKSGGIMKIWEYTPPWKSTVINPDIKGLLFYPSKIYGFFIDENGNLIMKSTIDFINWKFEEKIHDAIPEGTIGLIRVPSNFQDIPFGEKYVLTTAINTDINDNQSSKDALLIEMIK